jgi:hypothetical protein
LLLFPVPDFAFPGCTAGLGAEGWPSPDRLLRQGIADCGPENEIQGDFYHTFTFEKQRSGEQVLALLADGCPGVVLEPERPARKVCEAADG